MQSIAPDKRLRLSTVAIMMMAIRTLLTLAVLIAVGQAQTAPNGYTFIADNDYIDAGPLTTINQTITTLQACADACDQDSLCQSIMFSTFCTMYRMRRCMNPAVQRNAAPIFSQGKIYEKNSPVPIADGSQIVTICGNYTGPVVDSFSTTVPADFGPNLDANVASFTANCSQKCGSTPNCHSWRFLEEYENNRNVPVILRCTLYSDSIYDVPNHGFYSTLAGLCKRASSTYAIKGPAVSRFNCTGAGAGAVGTMATSSPSVGQGNTTATDAPAIVTPPSDATMTTPTAMATSWAATSRSSNSTTSSISSSSGNSTGATPVKSGTSTLSFAICHAVLALAAVMIYLC